MQARQEWPRQSARGVRLPGCWAISSAFRQAALRSSSRAAHRARLAHHVQRALDRIGRHRNAAGQRLQQHQAEGVGAAGKDEDVAAGIGPDQRLARQRAQESRDSGYLASTARPAPGRRPPPPWCRAGPAPGRPRCSFPPRRGRHRARSALHKAGDRSAMGWKCSTSTPRDQMRRCVKPCACHFALQGFRSPPSSRWRDRETSAASDRPAPPAPAENAHGHIRESGCGTTVEKAMPCLRQMRARASAPACLRWRYAPRRARIRGSLVSSVAARKQRQPDFRIGGQRHGEAAFGRGIAHAMAQAVRSSPSTSSVRTTPLTWGLQASVTIRIFKCAATPGIGPGSSRLVLRGYKRGQRPPRRRPAGCGVSLRRDCPAKNLHISAGIFDKGAAAFNPVSVVEVKDAADLADLGMMDMAAHHPVHAALSASRRHGFLEAGDIFDRVLDLVLQPGRQRPIGQAQRACAP